ncbi:MAG TPA: hypothetical protein PKV44_03545 [Bacillota bacterium]|nr:hypothetical protein [Bacillota bacterium]
MKKYLVIGGSGFIGRKLVDELCNENEVIVADINMADEFSGKKNVFCVRRERLTPWVAGA